MKKRNVLLIAVAALFVVTAIVIAQDFKFVDETEAISINMTDIYREDAFLLFDFSPESSLECVVTTLGYNFDSFNENDLPYSDEDYMYGLPNANDEKRLLLLTRKYSFCGVPASLQYWFNEESLIGLTISVEFDDIRGDEREAVIADLLEELERAFIDLDRTHITYESINYSADMWCAVDTNGNHSILLARKYTDRNINFKYTTQFEITIYVDNAESSAARRMCDKSEPNG